MTFVPSIPFSFRRFVFSSICTTLAHCTVRSFPSAVALSLHIFLVVVVKHSSSSNVVPLFLFACLLQICLLHLVVYASSALSLSFLRSLVPHIVAYFLFLFFSSSFLFSFFFSFSFLLVYFFLFSFLMAVSPQVVYACSALSSSFLLFWRRDFEPLARFLCPKGKEREREK